MHHDSDVLDDEYFKIEANISALCDDGTVWYLNDIRKGWAKYPDIPQDTQEEQPQAAN